MYKPHEWFYIAILTQENKKEKIIFKASDIWIQDYYSEKTIDAIIKKQLKDSKKPVSKLDKIRKAYYLEIEELYIPNN